jgi:hypothetical protein
MRFIEHSRLLVASVLLTVSGLGFADVPRGDVAETVIVESSWNCKEVAPERARWLAQKAWHDGAYQRAGECYVAAGDHALANEAFVKASAVSSGDTSQRLASNLNDVKAQARQMKQAFQRR